MIFCLTCRNALENYFIFVTACKELEKQCCYKTLVHKYPKACDVKHSQEEYDTSIVVKEELDIKTEIDADNKL